MMFERFINAIVRKLYQSRLLWVTSSDYARQYQLGTSPETLLSHIRICEKRYGINHFPVRIDDQKTHIDLSRKITHANDPIFVREVVLHGGGVSLLPNQYCDTHIKNGQLIQIFKNIVFDSSASELSAIYPSRRLISKKTKVFLGFLIDLCNEI